MFYHEQCKRVLSDFKSGYITKEEAYSKLTTIEERAYRDIPDAEPDGDITYCVACAVDEIDNT